MSDSGKAAASGGGISFMGVLAIVFITLKLTGHIAWSWWWVLAPLWVPPAVVLVIVLAFFLVVGVALSVAAIAEHYKSQKKKRK